MTIHFCATCGTKLYLSLERFPGVVGVYGGTFGDPDWFERTPENARHIFLDVAQHGTVIPAGFPTYRQHPSPPDGSAPEPAVFDVPHLIGRE